MNQYRKALSPLNLKNSGRFIFLSTEWTNPVHLCSRNSLFLLLIHIVTFTPNICKKYQPFIIMLSASKIPAK